MAVVGNLAHVLVAVSSAVVTFTGCLDYVQHSVIKQEKLKTEAVWLFLTSFVSSNSAVSCG